MIDHDTWLLRECTDNFNEPVGYKYEPGDPDDYDDRPYDPSIER